MISKPSITLAVALLACAAGLPAQTPAAPAPIASQETNFNGVTADVTEFRRKGNTLTAKVRLRNGGTAKTDVYVHYPKSYVLDAAAGKKYEVLKDDGGSYIAALSSSYHDAYNEDIPGGQSRVIWMKFAAPPATTKSATLQIEGAPPFEDLPIQDQ